MQSMKKILENVTQPETCSVHPVKAMTNRQETMSSSSTEINKSEKRIDLLFSKFAAFYGHIWRSQFKDEVFLKFAKKEWQDALSGYSDVVLTKAILNCRDFYELPPTLPQMMHCCRQIKKQTSVEVVAEKYVPANKELVLSCLQRCKEFLNK